METDCANMSFAFVKISPKTLFLSHCFDTWAYNITYKVGDYCNVCSSKEFKLKT